MDRMKWKGTPIGQYGSDLAFGVPLYKNIVIYIFGLIKKKGA